MKSLIVTTATILMVGLPATASTLSETYTSYLAFGDSLTDDGKFGALPPPSLGGRFSNGRTYAEYIADEITQNGNQSLNVAIGGATANDVNDEPFSILSTFQGQINFAIANIGGGLFTPGSKPLVSVFFGANDFFQGNDVVQAADDVTDGIRDLVAAGSTFGVTFADFLVLGLPDIGDTPAFADPAASAFATASVAAFNNRLFANFGDLESQGLNVIGFDTDVVFQEIRQSVIGGTFEFGIGDITIPCRASFRLPGQSCPDPNLLMFSDSVHPNAIVHQVIGSRVIAALEAEVATVPLPATLPLLIFAFGGLACVRRNRKT